MLAEAWAVAEELPRVGANPPVCGGIASGIEANRCGGGIAPRVAEGLMNLLKVAGLKLCVVISPLCLHIKSH